MEPTVTDWIQAIGTAAAALFAGGAFVVTYLLLQSEISARQAAEGERRRERADQEREQARLLTAWLGDPAGDADHYRCIVTLSIQNLSTEPVTALRVVGIYGDPDKVAAGANEREMLLLEKRLVPARSTETETLHVPYLEDLSGIRHSPPIRVQFTDAHGRRWERRPDSELIRVIESDDAGRADESERRDDRWP